MVTVYHYGTQRRSWRECRPIPRKLACPSLCEAPFGMLLVRVVLAAALLGATWYLGEVPGERLGSSVLS